MLRTSPVRRTSRRLRGEKPEVEYVDNITGLERFIKKEAKKGKKKKSKTPSPKYDSDSPADSDFFTASPYSSPDESPGSFYTAISSPSPKYSPPKPILDSIVKRLSPPKGNFLEQIQKGQRNLRKVSPKRRRSPKNLLNQIRGVKLRKVSPKRRRSPKKLSPKSQAILKRRQYIESPSPSPKSPSPKRRSPSPKRRKSKSPSPIKRFALSPGTLGNQIKKLKRRTSPKSRRSPKRNTAFDKIGYIGSIEKPDDSDDWSTD
jgi:hypothetical protein